MHLAPDARRFLLGNQRLASRTLKFCFTKKKDKNAFKKFETK
jgi:hypothetical protein